MKLLLKSVKVIDKHSAWNGQTVDIQIAQGRIEKIAKKISGSNYKVLELKNACICPSFVDMHASVPEPGMEHRENLNSGLKAAAAGGFSHVALMPHQQPTVQDKSGVEYIYSKSANEICQPLVIGALSKNREGKDMTEMYDMLMAGAKAFSDGDKSIQDAGFMSRSILYAKGINTFVISYAEDASISQNAKINEGEMSTILGMKGNPALAEEIMISRDLFLAEYQNARIHFSQISTTKSVELIRAAKKKGLSVTADVSIHHLSYDETALEDFDSNFKLRPPLRTKQDITALKNAIKDGTIDAISSQHTPIELEGKDVEFEIAKYGMISFQTYLSQLIKLSSKSLSLDDLLEAASYNPRAIFDMETVCIEEGSLAELCIFDTDKEWEFNEKTNLSKSSNSALFNKKIKGACLALIANNQIISNFK